MFNPIQRIVRLLKMPALIDQQRFLIDSQIAQINKQTEQLIRSALCFMPKVRK